MQITGNHQMARIERLNDESVREGYIRNGGKEVKLFTIAGSGIALIGRPIIKCPGVKTSYSLILSDNGTNGRELSIPSI
ncbi:hypothetical protein TNCV_1660071 [Trichonephila clavipes]|nr:hypothetical protein TNCV_1660071 [Trichonephila clavipes]